MTIDAPTATIIETAPVAADTGSYVDWPAIIAGIVLASAISLILLTFGSAIGLSFVNFRAAPDVSPIWVAIAAASWLLWVQVSSFMAGGYLTGRLRRRVDAATEHEVDVRDGAHGLLVWAGGTVIGAIIVVMGLGAAAGTVGSVASTATIAASNVADDAAASLDPTAYFTDTLFRPAPTAAGGTTVFRDTSAARAEAGRIFAAAADGSISAEDRTYLAQAVAANTGITEAEAATRVDQVVTAVDQAKAQAVATAEAARKSTVLGAFLTAAALLISAAGAYWAALMGGNHRDKQVAFVTMFRRY